MPFLDTRHQRAALLILVLGVALAFAMAPYFTGLIGAPVLYVVFGPIHARLRGRLKPWLSAGLVTTLAVLIIVIPGVMLATLIVNEAQDAAAMVANSPVLAKLRALRIGPIRLGAQLEGVGGQVVSWVGTNLLGWLGTAARLALNLVIAFFGLYFLLLRPGETWDALGPYIPFSAPNRKKLRKRFNDVTTSTLIGYGLTASIQGTLVAIGFLVTGLPNPGFWGVVTALTAILPVVGSAFIWLPGAIALALEGAYEQAVGLVLFGTLVIANVDNVIQPIVFRRWARIHPMVTLVGVLAGIRYFGLLGLLIGPLALSYLFELIRMYREEYLTDVEGEPTAVAAKSS